MAEAENRAGRGAMGMRMGDARFIDDFLALKTRQRGADEVIAKIDADGGGE